MDERLKKALDISNVMNVYEIQKKTISERLDAKLTYGYGGGIFKIDTALICFVGFLLSQGRSTDVPVLDSNRNPILITDLKLFQENILDRYFSGCFEYFNELESLKKNRSVKRIAEYE